MTGPALLLVAGLLCLSPEASDAFSQVPRVSSGVSRLHMAKGFGKAEPLKKKSEGQKTREDANANYDELTSSGVPEYNIFIREAGMPDTSWIPGGSMAVPRSEKVDNAIFANEEALVSGVIRMFPALKEAEAYEYGYNRKVFPDDPIRLAAPPSNDFIGNMLNKALSPLNTDSMEKKE